MEKLEKIGRKQVQAGDVLGNDAAQLAATLEGVVEAVYPGILAAVRVGEGGRVEIVKMAVTLLSPNGGHYSAEYFTVSAALAGPGKQRLVKALKILGYGLNTQDTGGNIPFSQAFANNNYVSPHAAGIGRLIPGVAGLGNII